jgi:hypothetical protein
MAQITKISGPFPEQIPEKHRDFRQNNQPQPSDQPGVSPPGTPHRSNHVEPNQDPPRNPEGRRAKTRDFEKSNQAEPPKTAVQSSQRGLNTDN